MQTDDLRPPHSGKRWIKIALAVSLAFNLLIVGFIAGSVARHSGGDGARAPAPGSFGLPYMMALTREDRKDVQRALRAGDALPDRRARRAMFRSVVTHLQARPFDAAALETAVEEQAGISIAVQRRVQQAWLEKVSAMSDDQRRAYATRIEALLDRRSR